MVGELEKAVLEAALDTVPVEFSIVDKNDNVLAWNKHDTRIFKRPKGVLGRNVRDCHPKQSLGKVEAILAEMKAGKRDKAQFWIDLRIGGEGDPQKVLIEYYALRSPSGEYLGCLEASQNITAMQKMTGQKRLLD